jgi:thiamine-phosphate pyrophosphorylase
VTRGDPRRGRGLPPLILISDAERVGEDRFLDACFAAFGAGLRAVLVREPGWGTERVRDLIRRVREGIPPAPRDPGDLPLWLLVGRRPELAQEAGADGVHVGGGRPEEVARARSVVGPDPLVGYSAHAIAELVEVARQGADYAFFSPVFGALSKRHTLVSVGIEGLRRACVASSIPVYALGGVIPAHAGEIRRAGGAGAAMIGAILDASDPAAAVREYLRGWREAESPPG